MFIREFGRQNEKQLLFFPGLCEPWAVFTEAARLLAEKYHVICIIPDGHAPEDHADFISVEKTADDALQFFSHFLYS